MDNPDIEFYTGHFDLQVLQFVGNQTVGLTLRNNLRRENRGVPVWTGQYNAAA